MRCVDKRLILCILDIFFLFKSIAYIKINFIFTFIFLIIWFTILRFSVYEAPTFSHIWMIHREKFFEISGAFVAYQLARAGIRLNRVAIAFFVAPYCAPSAHIKRECIFKSVRNDTAIIVRNYMQRCLRAWMTGGFQWFRYLVSPHTARYKSFFKAWSVQAIKN